MLCYLAGTAAVAAAVAVVRTKKYVEQQQAL
jgi:hypothetical protein